MRCAHIYIYREREHMRTQKRKFNMLAINYYSIIFLILRKKLVFEQRAHAFIHSIYIHINAMMNVHFNKCFIFSCNNYFI